MAHFADEPSRRSRRDLNEQRMGKCRRLAVLSNAREALLPDCGWRPYHETFCWCLEISSRLNIENRSAPSVRRCVWWGEPWIGFDTPLFRGPHGLGWVSFASIARRPMSLSKRYAKIEESESKMTSFSIDPTVCDLIFEQTNGHVGAIRTFLFHVISAGKTTKDSSLLPCLELNWPSIILSYLSMNTCSCDWRPRTSPAPIPCVLQARKSCHSCRCGSRWVDQARYFCQGSFNDLGFSFPATFWPGSW